MASLSVSSITDTTAYWTVSDLSNPFNTDWYMRMVISTGTVSNGSSTAPSGILDSKDAPATGTDTSVSSSMFGLTPNTTYTVYAYAQVASDGKYYSAGSFTFTTEPEPSSRPDGFAWTNTFTQGSDVNVTAAEWGSFQTRINEFRSYKGLASYSFTTVTAGNDMLGSEFDEGITAIDAMSPPTSTPSRGTAVTAAQFNDIRDSLNSIL